MQKLKHGLLIPLRNGAKPKTSATSFYLGILLEGMLPLNMLSRWLFFDVDSWILRVICDNILSSDVKFYLCQHPEHVQHLILVGPAGFSAQSDAKSEWITKFRATWKGAILNHLWESNFTPQKIIRYTCLFLSVFILSLALNWKFCCGCVLKH